MRLEDLLLFLVRQPGEERQDFRPAGDLVRLQCVGGFADLALAGEENKDVARAVLAEFVDRFEDAAYLPASLLIVIHAR